VEVEAQNQEEAKRLAAEQFQVDWSDSDRLELTTEISTEEGKLMKWSPDAFARDSNNPYVPEAEPALSARSQPKRRP
jgi:hypothetical protein